MRPVVGYQGGKRRLLPRLREVVPVRGMTRYVEPFVGMGAVYLDLRARGYDGPAVLADINPDVRAFWTAVHQEPDTLLAAAEGLGRVRPTVELYRSMVAEPVEGPERTARFLWLTNFAYGNEPPVHRGDGWKAVGTKLTSSERWGKTFPWADCVKRLRVVVEGLAGVPCEVRADAHAALADSRATDLVYADPPYKGTTGYKAGDCDYLALLRATPAWVVLSERDRGELAGWDCRMGSVVARRSHGTGANGHRAEALYLRRGSAWGSLTTTEDSADGT